VPKGKALMAAERGLGFPARREEIQRFGGASRRIVRVTPRKVDERSFAEVVTMDPGRNLGPRKQGGMATRFGERGGPGRFNDQFGSEGNDGGFRGREGVFQDRDRDQFHGGAN
jgi:hypothetical protein